MLPAIIGHKRNIAELNGLLQRKAVPSALLFTGPEGVGRQLVAKHLAASLLCEKGAVSGCGECSDCSYILAGTHPDLIVADCRDSESWSTQGVRALLSRLALRPFGARARVVIFDQVEELQIQALNVLLKTLEEPRPDNYFILLSSNISKLPTTVVSRCQRWLFNSFTLSEFKLLLSQQRNAGILLPSEITDEELFSISDGTLSGIVTDSATAEMLREVPGVIRQVSEGQGYVASAFSSRFAKDRGSAVVALQSIQVEARKNMLAEQSPQKRRFWAALLTNAVAAPRLIEERYLSPALIIQTVLLTVEGIGVIHNLSAEKPAYLEEIVQ